MSIVVYSKNNCVFCSKAKALLKNLGLEYEEKTLEKDFGSDPSKLIEDIGKNVRQMPQIKIDDELIGGYDEKKGVKFKIEGYLEEFALTKSEADDLIIKARDIVFK